MIKSIEILMQMDTYQLKRSPGPVCWNCSNSGESMGGGMLKIKCPVCSVKSEDKQLFVDKRTKSYKKAHADLMELGLSNEEAHDKLNARE